METKACKKDFSRIGWRMLVSTILITMIQMGCQSLVLMFKPEWAENSDIMLAAVMAPLYVIGFPLAFLLVRKKDAPVPERHSMKPWQIILAFMCAYGLLVVGNMVGLSLTTGIGLLKGDSVENPLINVITGGNLWISAIYMVLLAPLFEEILFRKLICDQTLRYGQGTAVVVSGMVFGLFHLNFNQFFYAFLIGCLFAFIYVKTGSIWYSVILHMMVNFVGSVLGGLMMTSIDMESPVGMAVYAVYGICIYAIAIAGIVLLLVNKSKCKMQAGEVTLEKGTRFRTVVLNPGMLLYCILCLGVMAAQAVL
ncbi:MAG: CPBP family intramembrane metalloprotease [Lachnospiraceae bacterium]|nr:CPBP family intramembrane metalloprotease [Lachnospiraceae bacterium]